MPKRSQKRNKKYNKNKVNKSTAKHCEFKSSSDKLSENGNMIITHNGHNITKTDRYAVSFAHKWLLIVRVFCKTQLGDSYIDETEFTYSTEHFLDEIKKNAEEEAEKIIKKTNLAHFQKWDWRAKALQ